MDFGQAIASGFQGYVRFEGRSSRSEFWFWVLFVLVASGIAAVLDGFLFAGKLPLLSVIFGLGTFLPGLSVTVRRLHDINKSGWWYWLWLIPLIGMIILIVWACRSGDEGDNRFGANPLDRRGPA